MTAGPRRSSVAPMSEIGGAEERAAATPDAATERLAAAQQRLVAAITGNGETPAGFDAARVELTRTSLLAKRAGEVRSVWPALADDLGAQFGAVFAAWAAHRPTRGSLQDGWLLASERLAAGGLGEAAVLELAMCEARLVFDLSARPRRRRGLRVRRPSDGSWVIGWRGRVWVR